MKKFKFFAMAVALVMGLTAVSCSSKDDDNIAKEVAGSYAGEMSMSVMSNDYGTFDATLVLAAETDNTIKVTVPAFGEGHMAMPELGISGVKVTKDGSNYTLTKDEFSITIGETNYTGSVNGTVKDKKLTAQLSVKPGAMPMSINLDFTTK